MNKTDTILYVKWSFYFELRNQQIVNDRVPRALFILIFYSLRKKLLIVIVYVKLVIGKDISTIRVFVNKKKLKRQRQEHVSLEAN